MKSEAIVVRAGLLLLSLAALAGSAAEIAVSSGLESDFKTNRRFCRYFLCDETTVATYAYQQQLARDGNSLKVAVDILREVVARDPASAERWIDLGEALSAAGSGSEARLCIGRALELGNTSADVLVPAGYFYLLSGERREGLRNLSRALALTPAFDAAIFSYFSAQNVQVPELLNFGVLDEKRVAQAYLRYALAEKDLPSAQATWHWSTTHDFADQQLTTEYVNFLAAQKHFDAAAGVWASQFGYRVSGYRNTEYLYNGTFENEPMPGAFFDWQITPSENVEIARDLQTGTWSLRIRFDGSANLNFNHVSQKIVVSPGSYRFRARVRMENITTDQGLFFRIADAEAPQRLTTVTEPLLGTSDWHMVETAFVAGPATHLIEITVNRRPSIRFDSKIKGTIWISELSVAPL